MCFRKATCLTVVVSFWTAFMFNMKQKLKISFNFVSSLSVVCLISVLHSLWKCFNKCLSKQMEVSGYEAIEYCKASIKCPDGKEEYELVLL